MQACRRLLVVLSILLLHRLVLLGLSLGSLLLNRLLVVVDLFGSALALSSLLDLATLGVRSLALL